MVAPLRRVALGFAVALSCTSSLPTTLPPPPATSMPAAATAAPTPSPSPAASPSATRPPPSPQPTDATGRVLLEERVALLAPSWRPAGATAIATTSDLFEMTVWAVPLAAGQGSVALARVRAPASGWAVRPDGGAFVFTVATRDGAGHETRLAIWDAAGGQLRWLTPVLDGVTVQYPAFSPDGRFVYFSRVRLAQGAGVTEEGIWRIISNGTELALVRPPDPPGSLGTFIHGVTPDGRGLAWGHVGLEGATLEILDLASGAARSFAPRPAILNDWRAARPRALVTRQGGNQPDSELMLWDDLDPPVTRTIAGPRLFVMGADFDPAGDRIVASLGSTLGQQFLTIFTGQGAPAGQIAATEGAASPRWVQEGIVYVHFERSGAQPRTLFEPREVRIVAPAGGAPATLFTGANVQLVAIVRP